MEVYKIDCSKPDCWNFIVEKNKANIFNVINKIRPLYEKYLPIINFTLRIVGTGVALYNEEISEISKILEITFGETLILQLVYEAFSACTSAVFEVGDEYIHFRTMDWDMPALKKITFTYQMYDKNKYLFDAIGWAGCVGCFTAFKKNKYTISLNYRRSNSENFNLMNNVMPLIKGFYPHSYFIRRLLSSDVDPYLSIKNAKFISPAYYVITSEKFSGAIGRDRESVVFVKEAPIVQTNCDEIYKGDNILLSFERLQQMNKYVGKKCEIDQLIEESKIFPVLNQETIYTVIMNKDQFIYINV